MVSPRRCGAAVYDVSYAYRKLTLRTELCS
jgi:hypothetical protein